MHYSSIFQCLDESSMPADAAVLTAPTLKTMSSIGCAVNPCPIKKATKFRCEFAFCQWGVIFKMK